MISYAPENLPKELNIANYVVFLAGSIEMGTAENWQDEFANNIDGDDIVIFNPRRPEWEDFDQDSPEMYEQINWELSRIEISNYIVFYFDPDTKSPISLLELGLCIGKNKHILVVCPDGFWKKTNVVETCNRYGIPVYNELDDLYEIF